MRCRRLAILNGGALAYIGTYRNPLWATSNDRRRSSMEQSQLKELLLQSLEHERGGIQVYEAALQCAVNDQLKDEWEKYFDQTRNHERILIGVLQQLSLDSEEQSP